MKYNGGAEVSDLVKVTKISAINVEKVMTAEFTLSDSDASILCYQNIGFCPVVFNLINS